VPVASGRLKNSIEVYVQDNDLIVEYDSYGIYTNLGTGPFRVDEADKWEGDKEVTGGVFAQEWTAIPETDISEIDEMVEKEFDKALDKVEDPKDIMIEI
jgi:hypothetical protein